MPVFCQTCKASVSPVVHSDQQKGKKEVLQLISISMVEPKNSAARMISLEPTDFTSTDTSVARQPSWHRCGALHIESNHENTAIYLYSVLRCAGSLSPDMINKV